MNCVVAIWREFTAGPSLWMWSGAVGAVVGMSSGRGFDERNGKRQLQRYVQRGVETKDCRCEASSAVYAAHFDTALVRHR